MSARIVCTAFVCQLFQFFSCISLQIRLIFSEKRAIFFTFSLYDTHILTSSVRHFQLRARHCGQWCLTGYTRCTSQAPQPILVELTHSIAHSTEPQISEHSSSRRAIPLSHSAPFEPPLHFKTIQYISIKCYTLFYISKIAFIAIVNGCHSKVLPHCV